MYNNGMIKLKKHKFTTREWDLIKNDLGYYLAECHHVLGRRYEYLGTLQLLTPNEHRGAGHKKNIIGVTEMVLAQNVEKWVDTLSADVFNYFADKKLLGTEDENKISIITGLEGF